MFKKLSTILLALSLIAACSFTGKTDKTKKQTEMSTIQMTDSMFIEKVMDYKSDSKEWKYKGDKPAIIDFYATWCGPCRSIAPVLEELAKEYAGEIYIYKVDTDKEENLAALFGIRSIPSILFIPMEGQPTMMGGARPKSEFKEAIDSILLKK